MINILQYLIIHNLQKMSWKYSQSMKSTILVSAAMRATVVVEVMS